MVNNAADAEICSVRKTSSKHGKVRPEKAATFTMEAPSHVLPQTLSDLPADGSWLSGLAHGTYLDPSDLQSSRCGHQKEKKEKKINAHRPCAARDTDIERRREATPPTGRQ